MQAASDDSGSEIAVYVPEPSQMVSPFFSSGDAQTVIVEDAGIRPQDMSFWFHEFSSMAHCDLSRLDTSDVTKLNRMFYNCKSLATLNISGFATSKVTTMDWMFYNCSSLTSLDLSSWDTSSVTNMDYMFDYCSKLREVTLGEKFAWVGKAGCLPTPSTSNIAGADGKWYAKYALTAYAPEDIPSNKADTYYASKSLLPSSDEGALDDSIDSNGQGDPSDDSPADSLEASSGVDSGEFDSSSDEQASEDSNDDEDDSAEEPSEDNTEESGVIPANVEGKTEDSEAV